MVIQFRQQCYPIIDSGANCAREGSYGKKWERERHVHRGLPILAAIQGPSDTQGYALGQCVLQGAVTHHAKPGISMQDDSPVELILEVHLRFIGECHVLVRI